MGINAKKFVFVLSGFGLLAYAVKAFSKPKEQSVTSYYVTNYGDSYVPQASYTPEYAYTNDLLPEIATLPITYQTPSGSSNMSRGERNNNPGNIRLTDTAWQGKSSTQTDSAFTQFVSPEYGIRALAKTLMTYYNNYGLNTISGIISRWAPPNENNTSSYISAVSRDMGVGPNDRLYLTNIDTLAALAKAIIKHENGRVIYSDAVIYDGVSLAV